MSIDSQALLCRPRAYTSGSTGSLQFAARGCRCLDHWPGSGYSDARHRDGFLGGSCENRTPSSANRFGSLTSYAQTAKVLAPSSEIGHRRQARKLPVSVDYEWPLFCKHSIAFGRVPCVHNIRGTRKLNSDSDISASRIRSLKR